TGKDFPLAVNDKLVEIIGNRFTQTEIPGIRRYFDAHFFTHPEIVIHGILTRHDYRRKLVRTYPVSSEFLLRDPFYMNKGPPINLHRIFFSKLVVGRTFWLGLINKDGIYSFDLSTHLCDRGIRHSV